MGDEDQIAEAVEAGTDAVAVPGEMLDEAAPRVEQASLALRLREMGVAERIKLALRGNREVRMLLVRDSNRLIRRFVLRNPRLGDEELVAVAQTRSADDELLRMIAANRQWMGNYQIRHALVTNPKTPLAISLRHIGALHDRDLRRLAKSKNVSGAIAAQAKRLVLRRPGGG
jgi:hypothetical protein